MLMASFLSTPNQCSYEIKTGEPDKTIRMVEKDHKVYFSVLAQGLETVLPFYDVTGVPSTIRLKNLVLLLQHAQVQLKSFVEGGYKLDIQPTLVGGANSITDASKLWPNGIVPYAIDNAKYPIGAESRRMILETIEIWNQTASVQFVTCINEEQDIVVFGEDPDSGPPSIGYQGGKQYLSCHLYGNFLSKASILHTMGHAVGLCHEHQREDRDGYVTLAKEAFNTHCHDKLSLENKHGPYDFRSIMHCPINKDLADGQRINAKKILAGARSIGKAEILSEGDIAAIAHLYPLALPARAAAAAAPASETPPLSSQEKVEQRKYNQLKTQANDLLQHSKFEQALDHYTRIVREYNRFFDLAERADFYNRYGICYSHLKKYALANVCYELASIIMPSDSCYSDNYQHSKKEWEKLQSTDSAP